MVIQIEMIFQIEKLFYLKAFKVFHAKIYHFIPKQMDNINSLKKDQATQQYEPSKDEHKENVLLKNNHLLSKQRPILKSLDRIGICLNGYPTSMISGNALDKVCFILINNFEKENDEHEVGPLNDGYLVGLKHYRHGFKVFYLYNPCSEEFSAYLCFFLKYAVQALTVFYSGRGSDRREGIEFKDKTISKSSINKYILNECKGNKQVMFITDCLDGGSVFDIQGENHEFNLISFSVTKTLDSSKENKRTRGIFTYYFCKITDDFPNITPKKLVDRMNPPLNHFDEVFSCETSRKELSDSPIFF